jgi:hypothetical protein
MSVSLSMGSKEFFDSVPYLEGMIFWIPPSFRNRETIEHPIQSDT